MQCCFFFPKMKKLQCNLLLEKKRMKEKRLPENSNDRKEVKLSKTSNIILNKFFFKIFFKVSYSNVMRNNLFEIWKNDRE